MNSNHQSSQSPSTRIQKQQKEAKEKVDVLTLQLSEMVSYIEEVRGDLLSFHIGIGDSYNKFLEQAYVEFPDEMCKKSSSLIEEHAVRLKEASADLKSAMKELRGLSVILAREDADNDDFDLDLGASK